eukprot:scaffold122976_cov28-Tisochrysis_lutea.AAC.3
MPFCRVPERRPSLSCSSDAPLGGPSISWAGILCLRPRGPWPGRSKFLSGLDGLRRGIMGLRPSRNPRGNDLAGRLRS